MVAAESNRQVDSKRLTAGWGGHFPSGMSVKGP